MATPTGFSSFQSKQDEQAIDEGNIVAIVPDVDGTSSLVIHVEPNSADTATPPTVKFSKVASSTSSPTPQAPRQLEVGETHIVISTGSGGNYASHFFSEAVSPVLQALYPTSYPDYHVHTTKSADCVLGLTTRVFFPRANAGVRLQVILLSGDGGIVDLLNGLLSEPSSAKYTPPKVIVLPRTFAFPIAKYHPS